MKNKNGKKTNHVLGGLANWKNKKITPKQKNALQVIYDSIKSSGFSPTLADLRVDLNVSSNQSVLNFLDSLEKKQLIKRKEGQARSLQILPLGYREIGKNPLIQVVGTSAAGPYIESYSNAFTEWQSVEPGIWGEDSITKSKDDVFIIRVQGDSMINIGIDNDDMLLIKETGEFKSGDIVVAETADGTTIKRFIIDGGRIYLQPENPDYETITIIPEEINFKGRVVLNLSKVNE
jgi:repressor LexA